MYRLWLCSASLRCVAQTGILAVSFIALANLSAALALTVAYVRMCGRLPSVVIVHRRLARSANSCFQWWLPTMQILSQARPPPGLSAQPEVQQPEATNPFDLLSAGDN